MDLGIAGRRAAVAASSQGLGFGVAQALAAKACRLRSVVVARMRSRTRLGASARMQSRSSPMSARPTGRSASCMPRERRSVASTSSSPTPAARLPGHFASATLDQYLDAFELNCRSAIAMCIDAVPEMRARRWGRIVAITSIAVRQPMPNLILSNTARAGLTGFLKTLAREVAADGVTVNSLLPGSHRTDRMTYPLRRRGPQQTSRRRSRRSDSARPPSSVRWPRSCARKLPGSSPGPHWPSTAAATRHSCSDAPPRRVLAVQTRSDRPQTARRSRTRWPALPARIPQLRDYRFGTDAGISRRQLRLRGGRRRRRRRRIRGVPRRPGAPTHHRPN